MLYKYEIIGGLVPHSFSKSIYFLSITKSMVIWFCILYIYYFNRLCVSSKGTMYTYNICIYCLPTPTHGVSWFLVGEFITFHLSKLKRYIWTCKYNSIFKFIDDNRLNSIFEFVDDNRLNYMNGPLFVYNKLYV